MRNITNAGLVVLAFFVLVPSVVSAQSSFAGIVRDTSGGVLPGVTVEVSSPVLIEKVRTAVTDGGGLYKIVDLRPGVYTVTFTVAGFNTVKREGLELLTGFTATVNAEMRVGAIEETITVSGQTPVVDLQSVTQERVLAQDVIEALPAMRGPNSMTAFVPGVVTQNLGGDTQGKFTKSLSIHGSRSGEETTQVDGFPTRKTRGTGGSDEAYFMNPAIIEEISVQSAGLSAELPTSGIVTNVIPKEGSNTFTYSLFTSYADENVSMSNLSDRLRSRGVTAVDGIKQLWEFNPAMGGRILADKLWFFSSYRNAGGISYVANNYYNLTPTAWVYTPDLTRPAYAKTTDGSYTTRLTWQANPKNKIGVSFDYQPHITFNRNYAPTVSPEATTYTEYIPNSFGQVVWKSPVNNRLLLEAGIAQVNSNKDQALQNGEIGVIVDPTTISATEQSTGMVFRSPTFSATGGTAQSNPVHLRQDGLTNIRFAASYVTGSHAFKAGFGFIRGYNNDSLSPNGDLAVTLLNGVPRSLTIGATPFKVDMRINADLGLFVQDQWTTKRLTLNAGVRYDYLQGSAEPVHLPAVRFVGARDFPGVDNVPNWRDISPRLGAVYDLFGDGKTALKASVSRYLIGVGTQYAQIFNGVATATPFTSRTWTDRNGDFVPDCNLIDPLTNGECGPMSDTNFGKNNPRATRYDPALLQGFGNRGYNWETSVGVQHELVGGVSVNAGYFRRWYGNFQVTDNQLVEPGDYSPYSITAPIDSRLPQGGGNVLSGFYDLSPSKFGQVQNFVTFAKNYGEQAEIFNGVDVTVSARSARFNGAQLSGGVSTGRIETKQCFVVDSPQQMYQCDVKPPFQPNIKVFGVYPLPWWDIQTSVVYQNVPAARITASYVATNAQIRPSLGRDLSSGANGTATLEIIQPGTMWEPRMSEVDLRITKTFRVRRVRLLASLDVINLFNSSGIPSITTRYGPLWQNAAIVQGPRFFQFSSQLNF
jgi:hypothetical protein